MIVKTTADWEPESAELLHELREFAAVMRRAPFQNSEGLRGVSAFALYWFLRRVRPAVVFEVGVWKGFGTWLIERAAPDATVFCFDPIFSLEGYFDPQKVGRTYRSPRAQYSGQDFSCARIEAVVPKFGRPLVVFDDHQDKLSRLQQAKKAGIRDIVFDDNTSRAYTHRTLEQEREEPESLAWLEQEVESYEIFPALWPVDFRYGEQHVVEAGLGFPIEKELRNIYDERQWHSYVTYVRLR